jgi:UDP-3-O-[3-hydroxymyristoyl] N-acetylglucosamine deacetylase
VILRRHTVAGIVTFEGLGLHSGSPVVVKVHPGEDGIAFRYRSDRVLARPANISETNRCTKLGPISTVEHIMSAFAALEITDAEVELDYPEMPALDGAAGVYTREFQIAGLASTGERELPDLFQRVYLQQDAIKIAIGKGEGRWRFKFDSGDRWPGVQEFDLEDFNRFPEEVAPARTFGWDEEVAQLVLAGKAGGLDINSALVLASNGYRNEPLFPDEPARHKLLDLIGDLYLSGVPVRALNVVAERSGHRTNVAIAVRLREAIFGAD